MKVFGIVGHSGMGKTTLLERLVPELGRLPLWPDWPGIVAMASDTRAAEAQASGCPQLALHDSATIASFVWAQAAPRGVQAGR